MNGDTNFAAAGLEWRLRLTDDWSAQPSVGLALHDGATRNRYEPSPEHATDYSRHHQMLGSRVLFREAIALERRIDERRSVAVFYEHLSNGGELFGNDNNQGLNQIGVRLTIRLN